MALRSIPVHILFEPEFSKFAWAYSEDSNQSVHLQSDLSRPPRLSFPSERLDLWLAKDSDQTVRMCIVQADQSSLGAHANLIFFALFAEHKLILV